MTDQERFEAFLHGLHWEVKTFPTSGITELPMGSREDIHYVTHDTMICFSYCDLYFRDGTLTAAIRCDGRKGQHDDIPSTS